MAKGISNFTIAKGFEEIEDEDIKNNFVGGLSLKLHE